MLLTNRIVKELIPTIDRYFKYGNSAVPLFDQDSFMKLLTRWYGHASEREAASRACILVVVALGLQSCEHTEQTDADRDLADYCLRNAQVAVPELAIRDHDILGLQVLTALSMLFRNGLD
jgi:hypothetical protein